MVNTVASRTGITEGPPFRRFVGRDGDRAESGEAVVVSTPLLFAASRADHWSRQHYIAADHKVWVAVCKIAGSTGGGYAQAAGCSGIWKSDGVLVAQAGRVRRHARATLG